MSDSLKFSVNVAALIKTLLPIFEVASKGIVKDNINMHKMTITAKGDQVSATAFGGKLACTVRISALDQVAGFVVNGEGSMTLNSVDFRKTLDSFPETDVINVSSNGNVVSISRQADTEEHLDLPLLKDDVTAPKMATSFDLEIKIDRGVFLESVKKTIWALGFLNKEIYTYLRFIAEPGRAEFAAGTGGRFYTHAIDGKNFMTVKGREEILFNGNQIPVIQTILGMIEVEGTKSDDLYIRGSNKGTTDAPAQIVFSVGDFNLILVGIDSQLTFPKIEDTIKKDKINKIETKIADWEFATKGLMATFNEDIKKEHDTHESDICPDLDKQVIVVTSKGSMKAQRKVPIKNVVNRGTAKGNLVFHCATHYICEIANKFNKEATATIAFHDTDNEPIFVTVVDGKNDSRNTEITSTMFIASMK